MQTPSEAAMQEAIRHMRDLKRPQPSRRPTGLPALQQLAMHGRKLEEGGKRVIHQAAGDINALGQPLHSELQPWAENMRSSMTKPNGKAVFPRVAGEVFDGFSAGYDPQFPEVMPLIAKSIGIEKTPYKSLQTLSGRAAIDLAMMSMIVRVNEIQPGKQPVFIMDPLSWPGYQDLMEDYQKLHGKSFAALLHAPATEDSITMTSEGLEEALQYAKEHGQHPAGIIIINPSNPTGKSIEKEELKKIIEVATTHDIPVFIDAFYAPLAENGHEEATPMAYLERELAPEALAHVCVMYGSTKVTSSKKKTAEMFWLAPQGHDALATKLMGEMNQRMINRNLYPRPEEALMTAAIHTFPTGIHAAMGPRYAALAQTRLQLRGIFDDLGIPFSILNESGNGGSFYGTVALTDPTSGESYIRDKDGKPIGDPKAIAETLIAEYGLVGAPGNMFSPSSDATPMLRLSAAATQENIDALREIFTQMKENAIRHG